MVSAVLKRKVWINQGVYDVFPNQFIVLVGPPGVGKGTAIHPAHSFIRDFKPELANYISDRVSAERIIQKLAQGFPVQSVVNGAVVTSNESTAVIQAMELSTFLSSSDWMTSFMCDMWDRSHFEQDTKNKGTHIIKDMSVSLIGACVPEFIRKINGHRDAGAAINGGFTARAMFVFAGEKSKKISRPSSLENTINGPQTITNLRHDLEQIARNLKGEYKFSPDAYDRWDDWYLKLKIHDEDTDVVRHFKSRQPTHVQKVAMCLSAAQDDSMVISDWALSTAIVLVNEVLKTLDICFRSVGESSLAEATAKVQIFIERKGLCSRTELINAMHRHATIEDIDRIINTLEQMDVVRGYLNGGKQYYEHKHAGSPIKPGPGRPPSTIP